MTRKAWNHRKHCAEHRKVDGYAAKICVLPGQDPDEVVDFAEATARLAASLGLRQLKPGGATKRRFDPHSVCGGHFDFPAQGRVCYGNRRMSEAELTAAAAAARQFSEEIGQLTAANPRYARAFTSDFWSK